MSLSIKVPKIIGRRNIVITIQIVDIPDFQQVWKFSACAMNRKQFAKKIAVMSVASSAIGI